MPFLATPRTRHHCLVQGSLPVPALALVLKKARIDALEPSLRDCLSGGTP